jgi:hypothetical protein
MPHIDTIFEQVRADGRRGVLGMDDEARLYWNGHPVVTRQEVQLNWLVNAAVVAASAATVVSAVYTALMYYK